MGVSAETPARLRRWAPPGGDFRGPKCMIESGCLPKPICYFARSLVSGAAVSGLWRAPCVPCILELYRVRWCARHSIRRPST